MPVRLLQFIDLTSLEITDNHQTARRLVDTAHEIKNKTGFSIASICVYPWVVKAVKKNLGARPICSVASVAGGFPTGKMELEKKLNEIKYALNEGANEIDFVISRQPVFENNKDAVLAELSAAKKTCGTNLLKVILETGELKSAEAIELASICAIESGADFIKTSTGKVPVGATPEAFAIMLKVIKAHYEQTGSKVGIKVSGGVSETTTALDYMHQMEQELGTEWLTPKLFRIGASRLVEDILKKAGNTSAYRY